MRLENDFVLTDEMLEKINRFTRAKVSAEDVYTFPVTLCDNEVDRDGERFSLSALEKLAELFIGKTGIFDHDPKGEKQTARIFDCEVKSDGSQLTSSGEPYTYLSAKAYMMRTSKNADLIAEIDGGIKKEVSVSCSVRSKICSVCGADMNSDPCGHIKGNYYGGKLCSVILDEPTDAYEWSFVAVPAQKNAGVTKKYSDKQSDNDRLKALEKQLACQSQRSEKACSLLKREIISLSFLCRPIMAVETVKALTEKMSFEQLEELYRTLRKQAQTADDCEFQLALHSEKHPSDGNSQHYNHFKLG